MNRALFVFSLFLFFSCNEKEVKDNIRKERHHACGFKFTQSDTTLQGAKFVGFQDLFWEATEIKVYFMDMKDTSVKNKTIRYANLWFDSLNVRFVETRKVSGSDLRVSFRDGKGYHSFFGTLAKKHRGQTTISLDSLDFEPDDFFKSVVLHEFGHALGFVHEHQSPNSTLEWDTAALYAYYYLEYGWNREDVDQDIIGKFDGVLATEFDELSIMTYGFPADVMKNNKEVEWPLNLSKVDKINIKKYYK